MKRFPSPWLVVSMALLLGGHEKIVAAQAGEDVPGEEVIARIHSVGFADLAADPDGRTFKDIWALPVSAQLREEALDKLATALALHFEPKNKPAGTSCFRLLRPLLGDLWNAETFLEVRQRSQDQVESTLAVRLDEGRSRVWQTNWAQLISDWTLRTGGSYQLVTERTNGWFTVHCVSGAGQAAASGALAINSVMEKIHREQRPVGKAQEYWFRVEADLARAAQWVSKSTRADWPRIDLTVVGRKEQLRSQARLIFRDPMAPRVEKWDIPTEEIRDPLISFTALQGLGPWLKRQRLVQDLGLDAIPNQLYIWGLSQTAFQIQAAVPVPDATNALNRIATKAVPQYNRTLAEYAVGDIRPVAERAELMWRGLPIIVPYLRAERDHSRGFLHAGIFPVLAPTNSPPPQLFEQLTSQNNLLYYDWEITQARLSEIRPLLQLAAVFLTVSPMSTNSTASKWLDAVEPRLGNTVTEVSVVAPRELHFQRTSHAGLNALELLTLANWLEGTNFPRLNLDVRFRPVVKPSRPKPAH